MSYTIPNYSKVFLFRSISGRNVILYVLSAVSSSGKKTDIAKSRWSVCISPEAEADVLTGLLNRLEAVCLRTLIVEIQFCKAGGVLGNGDSTEQYGQFVEGYLRDRDQMIAFWQAYPYLYEVVLGEVERYVDFVEEILGHFAQDRKELADCFGRGEDICRIHHLQMDRGDIHGEGRSVTELELDGGMRRFFINRENEV